MSSFTLKNIPDHLLLALHAAAELDRRSLTQEILHLLELALRDRERPSGRSANVEAQVLAWRKLAGKWKSNVDHATESKSIMDRRSKGREVDL
jgi:hypothetical protein